jgi:hypothetical protein
MDPEINNSVPPVAPPVQPVPSPKPSFPKFLIIAVAALMLIIITSFAGYFVARYTLPVKTQTPAVNPTPTPTPDVMANWKIYNNSVQYYSFKYPQDWVINASEADQLQNSRLELTKNQAKFIVYANLIGIGGVGRDLEGTPITFNGISLYRYKALALDGKTINIGLTDALKQSLGVFQLNGQTYSITLSYPVTYDQTESGTNLHTEFDLMISTFKFQGKNQTSSVNSNNLESIANNLMTGYLNNYKNKASSDPGKITDYQIESINVREATSNASFDFDVYFSIKPVILESWAAGNGEPGADGWIRHKYQLVWAVKESNEWKINGMGTGGSE